MCCVNKVLLSHLDFDSESSFQKKLNEANKAKENWPKLQAFRDTLDKMTAKIHKDLSVWVFLAISSSR